MGIPPKLTSALMLSLFLMVVSPLDGTNSCSRLTIFPEQNRTAAVFPVTVCDKIESPLILTPYIETGQINVAQKLSQVKSDCFPDLLSYSAYFTVNKSDNSNMYFWFFPAEVSNPQDAPVIVWLHGGPGWSSLFGLLSGNGPYRVDNSLKVTLHPERWTKVANMLYFDNPIGTGFSFTTSKDGYSKNQDQVGKNLYQALLQFYTMFPQYKTGELYISGESYGGKYAPAVSYRIHLENPQADLKLPLKGLTIGDGLVDPVNQLQYGEQLYQLGMITLSEAEIFRAYESNYTRLIGEQKWAEAFHLYDEMLNGDIVNYPTFMYNVTHSNNYFNYLLTDFPVEWSNYDYLVDNCVIRSSLHVGNQRFTDVGNGRWRDVEIPLIEDIPQSVAPILAVLMNNYRVLIYNGVLDIICGQAGTDNYLSKLKWKRANEFKNAKKIFWKVNESDEEIAGYVRQVRDFVQIAVRNSGHVVPYDQPRVALDMITRFLERRSFTNE